MLDEEIGTFTNKRQEDEQNEFDRDDRVALSAIDTN
jgi:hypothetical protein